MALPIYCSQRVNAVDSGSTLNFASITISASVVLSAFSLKNWRLPGLRVVRLFYSYTAPKYVCSAGLFYVANVGLHLLTQQPATQPCIKRRIEAFMPRIFNNQII